MLLIFLVFTLIIGACAPEPQTTQQSLLATLTPLAALETTQCIQNSSPGAPAGVTPATPANNGCAAPVTGAAVQYTIEAALDWTTHTVTAAQDVRFYNTTGRLLDTLVFNIETNREPGYFMLTGIQRDTVPIQDYTLEGAVLSIPLDNPLPIGCSTTIRLMYTFTIPTFDEGYTFGHGYSARQLNLALWLPLVAWYDPAQGWRSPEYHHVGEYYVLQTSDFSLSLTVTNAPETLKVAGPGSMSHDDTNHWQFELTGAREIALSLSPEFKTLTTTTTSGVEVTLYYLGPAGADSLDTPRHALDVAVEAMTLFEELYGPYPHARLVVVEGDFPDGMEFSGLVFVSEAWFRTWQGQPNEWLTMITVHEVAHQWWYDLVGSDQGRYPYLDEALAIYSEALFFERYYPDLLQWWWDYRIGTYSPTGYVDTSVYDFQDARPYINAVYLRGALFIDALRSDLGDDVFFAWLQQYTDKMAGQIASPLDFWGMLSTEAYACTQATRAAYMHQANIVSRTDMIP